MLLEMNTKYLIVLVLVSQTFEDDSYAKVRLDKFYKELIVSP